ncbi:hypothetical protein SLE2022_344120 [Rubroshorea leprosula]
MATSLSFWLCFFLIPFSLSGSETRSILPFSMRNQALLEARHYSSKEISSRQDLQKISSRVTRRHSMMVEAKLVLKESMERQDGDPFEKPQRLSPGGPDPHHH